MVIDRLVEPILALPRVVKKGIVIAIDACVCVLTVWIAMSLRLGEWVALSGDGLPAAVVAPLLAIPIFVVFGLYRTVFRYLNWDALITISQAVLVYGVMYCAVFTAFAIPGVPRTVGVIQPVLLLIAIGATRAFGRYILGQQYRQRLRRASRKNVLIYGAGSAGRQLAAAIADALDTRVVGFVDDDPGLQGSVINRVRVWRPERLEAVVEEFGVEEVFLAVPSASRARRNEILALARDAGVAVRTLPGLLDLARGRVTVNDLRPLEIEDLLGRDPVAPDQALLERNIRGKTVLVTGAGGSIGSELCRQIAALSPARMLLVENSEYALYAVHQELEDRDGSPGRVELVPLLASVCDEDRMRRIFAAWRPQTVYHAAAYKHVPLVEHNIVEGVRNNVIGTQTCAELAREHGVESFVLISTDKAVRPTNVMGASKRLAEMVLQAVAAEGSTTCFSMVRFGNVLGSSGSVVPLFRQQIAAGGPVTVTHREITRYFMTIPEAAQLVIQAGAMAKGGDLFVLDMGEPVKVAELAVRMVELSGLRVRRDDNPDGDIEIVFSGLRPGEKLYEELLIGANPIATDHSRIMMAEEDFLPYGELSMRIGMLRQALGNQDVHGVLRMLVNIVPEYEPAAQVVDWISESEGKAAARRADRPAGAEVPASNVSPIDLSARTGQRVR